MENEITSTPAATPAPAAAPAVTATPAPTYTPPTSFSDGGDTSFMGILKGLNWVEIGISAIGVTALIYTISWYRNNLKIVKPEMAAMQNKIDDLTIKLSDVQSKLEKKGGEGSVNTQGFYI